MNKKKKNIIRVIAMILVMACFVGVAINEDMFISVKANGYDTVTVEEIDGKTYEISSISRHDYRKVSMVELSSLDKTEVIMENGVVKAVSYEYIGTNILGQEEYDVVKSIVQNVYDNSTQSLYRYTWDGKRTEKFSEKNNYWYQTGRSDYNNAYLKIGCKATYRLAYYKLKGDKLKRVDSYKAGINKINEILMSSEVTAIGTLAAEIISFIIATALVAPAAALIGIVAAAFSGAGAAVGLLVNAYFKLVEVQDLYAVIKTYGEKI